MVAGSAFCGLLGVFAHLTWVAVGLGSGGDPPAFLEQAAGRGLIYRVERLDSFGCGLLFADLDGDQDPDIVATGHYSSGLPPFSIGLFENDGTGHFVDRSATSGAPSLAEANGAIAADYDGDGDLDLFIACWFGVDALLRNDGGFQFTDVTVEAGVGDDGPAQGCCFGDFDGDGDLDLYVTNRTGSNYPDPPFEPSTHENRLYRNLGDGTFEEVAALFGVNGADDRSFQGCFFDQDRDGDVDLYLANDKGFSTGCAYRNRLWENVNGTFVDISQSSGTDGCIDAMCIAVGDLDGNRYPDLYVTNLPVGNPLYLNQGGGIYRESSVQYGVASNQIGWGSLFFDYDNDTYLDLYVCQHRDFEPNRLFDFNGTPPATDVAGLAGVDSTGESFSCAAADIDDDGDLDLLVSNRGGPLLLYVNQENSSRSWCKLRVVGEGMNLFGVGARIDVRTAALWQTRQVLAGSGFKSQDDLTVHFGLATAETLDEVVTMWPGGTTRTLQNYPARTTWTVYPPSRLGDHKGDGRVTLGDLVALVDCMNQAVAPGCEMMDANGDGVVDALDVPHFLSRYEGPLEDCDGNGRFDVEDILLGYAADVNRNGRADHCETDIVQLSGPTDLPAGTPLVLTLNAAPPSAPFWIYASWQRRGSVIQGHPFDLGPQLQLLGQGQTDASGAATWTSRSLAQPRLQQPTITLYLEARVDANGWTYDSNWRELVLQ